MHSKIKILIVDDHHLVRQGLRLILNDQYEVSFEIDEVDSGEKAIEHYKKNRFDVVLMDISMGEKNGIEATKEILEYDTNAKVIALSMHSETFMIRKMLDAGASGYVLKDTESNELLKAIQTVLDNQKYFTNEVALKLLGQFKEKQRESHNHDLPSTFKITKREIEIINLIAKQMTNEEIAIELGIKKRTIDTHRQKILEKLGLKNTAGLIMYAIKNHLLAD